MLEEEKRLDPRERRSSSSGRPGKSSEKIKRKKGILGINYKPIQKITLWPLKIHIFSLYLDFSQFDPT